MSKRGLSVKEKRFVAAYDGNGTAACKVAGYKGNGAVLATQASRLLRKAEVASEIAKREAAGLKSLVASREKRQEFWTEVMNTTHEAMGDRLRASELLGKSENDFKETSPLRGAVTITIVDPYAEPPK